MRSLLASSGEEVTKELIESIFELIDINNDGAITFEEFLH